MVNGMVGHVDLCRVSNVESPCLIIEKVDSTYLVGVEPRNVRFNSFDWAEEVLKVKSDSFRLSCKGDA